MSLNGKSAYGGINGWGYWGDEWSKHVVPVFAF